MAAVDPVSVPMKDGRDAVVRCPTEDDADQLLTSFRALLEDGAGQVARLDEVTVLTIEQERAWIHGRLEHQGELLLVADLEGVIAGSVHLLASPRRRMAHTAMLGIGLTNPHRGLGLGDALMTEAMRWAAAQRSIEKVGLRVRSDNDAAVALYRKHGFVEEGRLIRAIRFEDGRYVDDVLMAWFRPQ